MSSPNLNPNPKVTIAIPTLNRTSYLQIALDSALRQTYPAIEVIVSDNASSDGTAALLERVHDERLTVLRQEVTVTMVENWNACLESASGKYFLLLSDDDVLEPTAIAEMVAVFESDESVPERTGFVYCRGRIINGTGDFVSMGSAAPDYEQAEELVLGFFNGRRNLWPCAILYRRSDIGRYTADFALSTDAAVWMCNVARYGGARFVGKTLVNYRHHQNLTFRTTYETWANESSRLAEYALCVMKMHGRGDRLWAALVRRAQQRLNVRLAAMFINQEGKKSRAAALTVYFQRLRHFASFYGLYVLMKGILLLFLPSSIRSALRDLRT